MSTKSQRAPAKNTATVTVDHASPTPGRKARVVKPESVEPEVEEKTRKPHRFKSGTRAIFKIKAQQKNATKKSFARAPYGRLVRRKAREQSRSAEVRFTVGSLDTLQQLGEDHIVTNMSWANVLAVSNGRKTVMPKDLALILKIQPGGKAPSLWTTREMEEYDATL